MVSIRHAFRNAMVAAFDRPLAAPTRAEKQIIQEFRAAIQTLERTPPAQHSQAATLWIANMNELIECVLGQDPREFLRWPVISRTMFVSSARYLSSELRFLRGRSDWRSRWRLAIKETPVGHPPRYWKHPGTSGNLIHHAYHLAQFEDKTGTSISKLNYILEVGGGYGSMCRLMRNLNFRGRYVIFDLPAFSALQRFFLKAVGVTVHPFDSFRAAAEGVTCISDLPELRTILSELRMPADSMFISTWALSEMPLDLRDSILAMTSPFKTFLISYQEQFGEVDNSAFFTMWQGARPDVEWRGWRMHHLPHSHYLVGRPRPSL